jgi:hypothetical protein
MSTSVAYARRVTSGAMLRTEDGVTMVEITGALGVLPHTARAMTWVLRKKRDLAIKLTEGRYQVESPSSN